MKFTIIYKYLTRSFIKQHFDKLDSKLMFRILGIF